jgi:lipopolysaccharide cholinephosphotransferase
MGSLSKINCGSVASRADSRSMQMDMLDTIVDFCKQNNLRYYLSGGTLLGAVRHKGFIPWDDDIDINMPRPDIEKMYSISGGKIGKYELSKGGEDPYSPACQWYRLYSDEIIIENFYGGASDTPFYHPIFVDIFPIEGFPDSDVLSQLYSWKLIFIRKMLGVSWHKGIIAKNKKAFLAHVLAYIPSKIVGYKNWNKWFQKEVKRYDFESCKYVGVTSTVQYLPREKVPKKEYMDSVMVEFEGKMYSAPGNYDLYLSQLYHDYMKLPPVEKQKSDHTFKMYWKK